MSRAAAVIAIVLVSAATPAPGTVDPVRGFRGEDLVELGRTSVGGIAFGPGGEVLVHDVESGAVLVRGKGSSRVLAHTRPGAYGAFVVVAPGGEEVLFGDSSSESGGDIFAFPLAGGEMVLRDRIDRAFDLAFDSRGRGFVSALYAGPPNRIVLLDEDPGAANRDIVVDIPGWSGPVALDGAGNLFYGTADLQRPPSSQSIVRFPAARVEAALTGDPIRFEEGDEILSDLDGAYDLQYGGGVFFVSDLGFVAGRGAVWMIDPAHNYRMSPVARFGIENGAIQSPSFLAFRSGAVPFGPGIGAAGGEILVCYSEFPALNNIAVLSPDLYFVRSDANGDGAADISDAIAILAFLFTGGPAPSLAAAADVNDDGALDLSDPVYLLEFLFRGGPSIPAPFPEPGPDE